MIEKKNMKFSLWLYNDFRTFLRGGGGGGLSSSLNIKLYMFKPHKPKKHYTCLVGGFNASEKY